MRVQGCGFIIIPFSYAARMSFPADFITSMSVSVIDGKGFPEELLIDWSTSLQWSKVAAALFSNEKSELQSEQNKIN